MLETAAKKRDRHPMIWWASGCIWPAKYPIILNPRKRLPINTTVPTIICAICIGNQFTKKYRFEASKNMPKKHHIKYISRPWTNSRIWPVSIPDKSICPVLVNLILKSPQSVFYMKSGVCVLTAKQILFCLSSSMTKSWSPSPVSSSLLK